MSLSKNSECNKQDNDDEGPLLDELFSRLPDTVCRHIFAFRFHSFQTRSDLIGAVDKYLEGDAAFQRIQEWDVSQVEDFSFVFSRERNYRLRSFTADKPTWNVSKASTMNSMFHFCGDFNADISRWDVGNVRDFQHMFFMCGRLNQDLSNWNVGKAKNMSSMFWDCQAFNSDVSEWNVSKNVENMSHMFCACLDFRSDVSNWNVGKVENMSYMFYGCSTFCSSPFCSGVSNWNFNDAVDRSKIFGDTGLLNLSDDEEDNE